MKNNRYSLALDSIQMYLPQDQKMRVTAAMSKAGHHMGIGLGFAYMVDDESRTAFTLGIGKSGDEVAYKASVGFEFGGSRSKIDTKEMVIVDKPEAAPARPAPAPVEYEQQIVEEDVMLLQMAQSTLEDRITALEQKPAPRPRVVQQVAPAPEPAFTEEQKQAAWDALLGVSK